jgi:tetratricopeptide (TPR) repeat protein
VTEKEQTLLNQVLIKRKNFLTKNLRRLKSIKTREINSLKVISKFNENISFILLLNIDGKFEEALDMYSEAIFCKVPKKKKAIYYCNRALVNIKLENYAIALFGI